MTPPRRGLEPSRSIVPILAALASCGPPAIRERPPSAIIVEQELAPALASITASDLMRHMTALASPPFEGRAPGTRGEELTVDWIQRSLRAGGLAPGNTDGTYVQEVPLVGVVSRPGLRFEAGGKEIALRAGDDYSLWSYGPSPEVFAARSEMVFVGHGVVAPEIGWDDFKDVDVRGKTVVFLIGDPPVPDPADPSRLDPGTFRGDAMTYYGRWTYKLEIAAEKGAAAALIVHQTKPAGYGWAVVGANAGHERFDIAPTARRTRAHVGAEGWIHLDRAKELFAAAGHDFDRLAASAVRRDFRPVPLGAHASYAIRNTFREVRSRNVVARLAGSDPTLRDEVVIYSAHWDHLGKDGEKIYAGALDNASGVAWLLEIAQAYARLPRPPPRTVVFLAVTAEEYGLLGSRYWGEHPLYPLERTLANINMDVMNPWGRTRAIVSLGRGQTTMDDVLAEEAARQGRTVAADPEPEKGYYYRSDHFELARKGVPALGFLFPGTDYRDRPADYGARMRSAYVASTYHTPRDVVQADWDLEGAVEDTQLLFRVGLRVATETAWPAWRPGTEFRARRDAMLARAKGSAPEP